MGYMGVNSSVHIMRQWILQKMQKQSEGITQCEWALISSWMIQVPNTFEIFEQPFVKD